jgi:SAM-dependent methyltransferase
MIASASTDRLAYGPLTPWPERLAREGPLLEKTFADSPSPRLVDLGCGSGEHARYLAGCGFTVVGVDASREALDAARRMPLPPAVQLVQGDMGAVEALVRGQFGGALCLGNSLAHIVGTESLCRMMVGLRRRLLPGAPIILQTFNFDRIFHCHDRHLPLEFRRDEDGDLISLPLLEEQTDGILLFSPYVLRHRQGEEPPIEVVAARTMQLRGWRKWELEEVLEVAQFGSVTACGGWDESPFVELLSPQLILIAR